MGSQWIYIELVHLVFRPYVGDLWLKESSPMTEVCSLGHQASIITVIWQLNRISSFAINLYSIRADRLITSQNLKHPVDSVNRAWHRGDDFLRMFPELDLEEHILCVTLCSCSSTGPDSQGQASACSTTDCRSISARCSMAVPLDLGLFRYAVDFSARLS